MFLSAVCVTSFIYSSANLSHILLGLIEGVLRDAHTQVSVDAAATLSLAFTWGVEGTGVTSGHLENAQICTNLSVWRAKNGPEACWLILSV